MIVDDMNEDVAKEILDFLARKAGCDMMLRSNEFHIRYVLQVRESKTTPFSILYYVKNSGMIKNIGFSRKPTWKEALDRLLEISAKGLDILSYACNDNTFLKKNTALEQILIEMDLEANGTR